MKLDLDLLRDTLIAISDNLYPDENGCVQPILQKNLFHQLFLNINQMKFYIGFVGK